MVAVLPRSLISPLYAAVIVYGPSLDVSTPFATVQVCRLPDNAPPPVQLTLSPDAPTTVKETLPVNGIRVTVAGATTAVNVTCLPLTDDAVDCFSVTVVGAAVTDCDVLALLAAKAVLPP
jgi:hypothetical protein